LLWPTYYLDLAYHQTRVADVLRASVKVSFIYSMAFQFEN